MTRRQLATDSALYGTAAVIGKALALLSVPFLSRLLGPADYGLADLATSLAALLALVAMFSADIPAMRLRARAPTDAERKRVLTSYVAATALASSAIAVVLVPFAGSLATVVWGQPDAGSLAVLALVLVPISALQAALVNLQRIEGRPGAFAVLATVDLLAQLGLAVLLVFLGFGAAGVVVGFILGSLIGLAAATWPARHLLPVRPSLRLGLGQMQAGANFLPAVVLFLVADYAVRYLIVVTAGHESVGQFAVAIRVASVMTLVSAAFSMAWGPFGLSRRANRDTARLFGHVLWLSSAVLSASALGVAAVGPELVLIVSGPAYADASAMLPGLLLAAALGGVHYVVIVAAGVADRDVSVAWSALAGATVQIAATGLLLPAVGLLAVGIGAMLGRLASVFFLLPATGRALVVHRVRLPTILVIACTGAVLIQFLSQDAAGTVAVRLGLLFLFVCATAAAVSRLARIEYDTAA